MLGHLSPPESAGLKGGYCGIFRGQGLTGWCQALWGLITRAQFLLPFACCSFKTWGREETQLHSPATMESLPPSLSLCDELHSLLRVKIPSSWVAITRHFLSNKQSVCVCVKKGEMVTFARSAGGGVSLTGKISALLEKTQASPLFLAQYLHSKKVASMKPSRDTISADSTSASQFLDLGGINFCNPTHNVLLQQGQRLTF